MKTTILLLTLFLLPLACKAQGYHYVSGYYQSNGAYVPPHYATNPNGNFNDNWTTRGNVNPITGQPGYISQPPARPWQPWQPQQPARGYYDQNGFWHPASF